MSSAGISLGSAFLREAAAKYFSGIYQNPQMYVTGEVDPALGWQPSLYFKINDHLTVIAEVSEKPYPMIFNLRRVEIEQLSIPVSVYCVCPEEAYLEDQSEAKRLMAHGYGLITVDQSGNVQKRAGCIPIIQQISEADFKVEIKDLPIKLRQRLAEAFERYKQNAPSGSVDISEVIEGLIGTAAREAVRKTWINNSATRTIAGALAAMSADNHFNNAAAAIGGVQGYISMYRNANHHFPKNKKQAALKYKDCRHSFLDGLKKVKQFRDAMRNIGLTGNL